MNVLTQPLAHRLIDLACRAPSVHNTQPWRWRINSDDSIELWADRDRQLESLTLRGGTWRSAAVPPCTTSSWPVAQWA